MTLKNTLLNKLRLHLRKFLPQSGDTLIEVLIAISVISLVLIGAYSTTSQSSAAVRDAQERQEAQAIANSQVEWIVQNGGLPGTNTECFNSIGEVSRNSNGVGDCNFSTTNQSGCTPDASNGYCYNAIITVFTDGVGSLATTTFKVTITWDRVGGLGGGRNQLAFFYRLPIAGMTTPTPAPAPGPSPTPTPPPVGGAIISQIDVGNYHVCANSLTGSGYCWGKNDFGALGNGTNNNQSAPYEVNSAGALAGKTIVGTSAGYNHTCVVDSTGLVYCWGYNSQGQLGNGASGTTNNPFPTAVVTTGPISGKSVIRVNGGDSHTCALTQDGKIFCWGGNNYGQLGTGGTTSSFTPVEIRMSGVLAGKTLVDVSAGYAHTCAVASDGVAYCWGFNGHGQLGNGSTTDSSSPVAVGGALRFTQISAGDEHTCGVTFAGKLYCWGYNQQGQVGNGSLVDVNTPTAVATSGALNGIDITKVAAGYRHTCAIGNGNVSCWGNNDAGQLGNGEVYVTHTMAVTVDDSGAMGGRSMADIATGRYSSCAVATVGDGGGVYCWGKNDDGQLGDNKRPVDSSVPSLVTFP